MAAWPYGGGGFAAYLVCADTVLHERFLIYLSGFTLLGKEDYLRQIMIDAYRFVIGCSGTVALLNVLKLIYERLCRLKISAYLDLIRQLGKQPLSIYILSTYLFEYVLPRLTLGATVNYLLTLHESVAILAVCYSLGLLLQRSDVLRRLILGRGRTGKLRE